MSVVIITGASKGIGAAAAVYLAEQGHKVVLAARSAEKVGELALKIGASALAVPTDVSSASDMKNLFEKTVDKFGKVDVLVSNAGVIDPIAHIVDSDPEEWGKAIDINVKGVYLGLKYAADFHVKTVINISSGAATTALDGWSHYCASKAAVLMLTNCNSLLNLHFVDSLFM